jgi:hypothetical protein
MAVSTPNDNEQENLICKKFKIYVRCDKEMKKQVQHLHSTHTKQQHQQKKKKNLFCGWKLANQFTLKTEFIV